MRFTLPFLALSSSVLALSSLACGGGVQDVSAAPQPEADAGTYVAPAQPPKKPPPADAGTRTDGSVSPFGNGAPSNVYPAPHPAPPTVVSEGGPVLKAMKVIPVFFPGDEYEEQLTDFAKTHGTTEFWKANTEEYGVGPTRAGEAIHIATAPPASISDDDVQAFIKSKIGHDQAWGTPDDETLYLLFYPKATTISLQGERSCQTFGGYHSNLTKDDGKDLAYAVIPRCASFGNKHPLETATGSASHELIEAATDPFPQTRPAHSSVDEDHIAWAIFLGGGETSDLCAQSRASFFQPPGYAYTVQRSWSNKLALAGHDPCAPVLDGVPYFNSAVVLPDTVSIGGMTTKSVEIAVGKKRTVELDLFSDAPTEGPWTVNVFDTGEMTGGVQNLEFDLDRSSGVNGEKLNLTINVLSKGQYGVEGFFVVSTLGGRRNLWIGMVSN